MSQDNFQELVVKRETVTDIIKTYSRNSSLKLEISNDNFQECLLGCRLCFSQRNAHVQIFCPGSENKLSSKIEFCTGLEINEGDGLSKNICYSCHQKIISFCSFKNMCISNDSKLKQAIKDEPSNENIKNVMISNKVDDSSEIQKYEVNCIDVVKKEEINSTNQDLCLLEQDVCWLPDTPQGVISSSAKQEPLSDEEEIFEEEDIPKNVAAPRDVGICLSCEHCGLKFPRNHYLLSHESRVHNVSLFYCDVCSKAFRDVRQKEKHYKLHTAKKPYTCADCLKKFRHKPSLRRHIINHIKITPSFKCKYCSKVFSSKIGFVRHKKNYHDTYEVDGALYKRYKCKQCLKMFRYSSGLSRHLLFHSGVFFRCTICKMTFSDSSALRRHEQTFH